MPGVPPYYRPQLPPNTSPSGRKIDPRTGIIGSMPGGMDFLAGFGPAPAGVNLTPMAPVVHRGGLPGYGDRQQAFLEGLQRFKPATNRIATPYTPINPYASPTANLNVANQIQAANPSTPWWQTPGLFSGQQGPSTTPAQTSASPTAPPQVQWGGNGIPYGQINDVYKQMTAGLTPYQVLQMFPSTKP